MRLLARVHSRQSCRIRKDGEEMNEEYEEVEVYSGEPSGVGQPGEVYEFVGQIQLPKGFPPSSITLWVNGKPVVYGFQFPE